MEGRSRRRGRKRLLTSSECIGLAACTGNTFVALNRRCFAGLLELLRLVQRGTGEQLALTMSPG